MFTPRALVTTLAVALAAACSPADPAPSSSSTETTELSSVPCTSNADCDAQSYCVLPTGQCAGQGTCGTRPRFCSPSIVVPLCGCDGRTYGNACEAARAGTNVAHRKRVQEECGDTVSPPPASGP